MLCFLLLLVVRCYFFHFWLVLLAPASFGSLLSIFLSFIALSFCIVHACLLSFASLFLFLPSIPILGLSVSVHLSMIRSSCGRRSFRGSSGSLRYSPPYCTWRSVELLLLLTRCFCRARVLLMSCCFFMFSLCGEYLSLSVCLLLCSFLAFAIILKFPALVLVFIVSMCALSCADAQIHAFIFLLGLLCSPDSLSLICSFVHIFPSVLPFFFFFPSCLSLCDYPIFSFPFFSAAVLLQCLVAMQLSP